MPPQKRYRQPRLWHIVPYTAAPKQLNNKSFSTTFVSMVRGGLVWAAMLLIGPIQSSRLWHQLDRGLPHIWRTAPYSTTQRSLDNHTMLNRFFFEGESGRVGGTLSIDYPEKLNQPFAPKVQETWSTGWIGKIFLWPSRGKGERGKEGEEGRS